MEKLGKYPEWALEIFFWVSILCGYYKEIYFFKISVIKNCHIIGGMPPPTYALPC